MNIYIYIYTRLAHNEKTREAYQKHNYNATARYVFMVLSNSSLCLWNGAALCFCDESQAIMAQFLVCLQRDLEKKKTDNHLKKR